MWYEHSSYPYGDGYYGYPDHFGNGYDIFGDIGHSLVYHGDAHGDGGDYG